MSKSLVTALCGLNFCGWVLILASACYNQNKVGREALNFPLDWYGADQSTVTSWAATGSTIMRGAAQKWPVYNLGKGTVSEAVPDSLANMAFAPGGRALSYLWWITFFQFVGILLAGAALSKKELRIGAVGLFAVLTTSTFIYTADVYSAPRTGLYSLTHDKDLKVRVPTTANQPALVAYYKGIALLSAGLVTVDVCNVLTMILLPTLDAEASAASEPAADKAAAV